MQRLLDLGFVEAGEWTLHNGEIMCSILIHHDTRNVLYSFVCEGDIKYIGVTENGLVSRLYGYQKPGPSQSTNMKLNRNIHEMLSANKKVKVFVFKEEKTVYFKTYPINLAAGLEKTLIREFKPDWNTHGKYAKPVFLGRLPRIL